MSRIGRLPVSIPAGVTVTVADDNTVTVKGPKGTLTQKFNKDISLQQEGAVIHVTRPSDDKFHRSLHGLTRTLLNNMVQGVTNGFTKIAGDSGRRIPCCEAGQEACADRRLFSPG